MRICLVSEEYPPETARGGIGTQTWHKAHCLVDLGHTVHVLSCLPPRTATGPGMQTREIDGIVVHRMHPPAEGGEARFPVYEPAAYSLGYTWKVLEALGQLAGSEPFDLVNFPEYGAEGFAYQLNRTQWNWMPVVVQLHGPLAMFAERMGWPEPDTRFFRVGTFMEGESVRMADGLLASSANIADFTADAYGVERETIDVVHCAVDCKRFTPLDRERAGQRPTVLFAGNVEANKGVKTVFEACLRLRKDFPDILLRILGTGRLEAELAARSREAGAAENVEVLGFVKQRDALPEIYRSADVLASPADHEPGVANVYVEAMACGLPVVAASTGGAPEAVEHETTGLLVAPRDVEATEWALRRILGDRELSRRMGAAGRARAESYFATDRYIVRVLAGYEKALERARAKRARWEADPEAASR